MDYGIVQVYQFKVIKLHFKILNNEIIIYFSMLNFFCVLNKHDWTIIGRNSYYRLFKPEQLI